MEEKCTFKITEKGKSGNSDYPAADKIGSRSSTVARAMASTLMPRIGATDQDKRHIVLLSLGANIDDGIDSIINKEKDNLIKNKIIDKNKEIGSSYIKDIRDERENVIRTLTRNE